MSYLTNGEINILHALGSPAKLAVTGVTGRVALPLGTDKELKAVSITAVGGAVCFAIGNNAVVATQDSHYLGENDTREFLVGDATHIAAIGYGSVTSAALRITVLKRGVTVNKELHG